MNIALIIIFAFAIIALYLGIRATHGKKMSMDEFATGNKGFGTLFVFLLTAGEVYTTFSFLGGSGWAYSNGAAAFYVPAYITLAYVLSYYRIGLHQKFGAFQKKIMSFHSQHTLQQDIKVLC